MSGMLEASGELRWFLTDGESACPYAFCRSLVSPHSSPHLIEASDITILQEAAYARGHRDAMQRVDELRLIEPNEPDHPGPYYDGWHDALDAIERSFAKTGLIPQ